jgi:hypothetical protein
MASLGQLTGGALAAVVVSVVLMVFGMVLPLLNQAAIGASAYTLILVVPIIIAAGLIIGIVMQVFSGNMG